MTNIFYILVPVDNQLCATSDTKPQSSSLNNMPSAATIPPSETPKSTDSDFGKRFEYNRLRNEFKIKPHYLTLFLMFILTYKCQY